MTIPCIADNGDKCPYIRFCLARINDPTIVGCGCPLYWNGLIDRGSIYVVHRVKQEEVQPRREKKAKKKKKRGAE